MRWKTQSCLGFGGGRQQFSIHASVALSRYISYVEEFLVDDRLPFC